MHLTQKLQAVKRKANELNYAVHVTWKVAPQAPADPVNAAMDPSWPDWTHGIHRKYEENWYYADVTLPKEHLGLEAGSKGMMVFINGWLPFTLWIDGQECFKEERNWKGTGPIADPLPVPFKTDRPYRLVARIVPTDAPPDQAFTVEFRSQAISELQSRVDAVAAELEMAFRLVKGTPDARKLTRAAAKLDTEALNANDFEAFLTSARIFEKAMAWLSPRVKQRTIHVIGHTHLDMDWMWTWEDTVQCVRRDFKAVTDLMRDEPEVTFTHSQVPTYLVAQKEDPGVFEQVKQVIAEGRWENAAGTWVEGDLNMSDGESVARQMLYASDWCKANLGKAAKVMWEPDTFGHPGNMPQLARLGELDMYFHMRCNPAPDYGQWGAYQWRGIDGTKIPVFSLWYGGGLAPTGMIGLHLMFMDQAQLKNTMHIWGLGDHGGGLPRYWLDHLKLWRELPLIPTIRFATMPELLKAVKADKTARLPQAKGEQPSLFAGCFTTHALTKRYNRLCEGTLLTAETLSTLAGLDRREAIRAAWLPVLFNQFHDIFDGAAVHDSARAAHKRHKASLAAADKIVQESLAAIIKPSATGKRLTVTNPLGFECTGPVRAQLPEGTACLTGVDGSVVPVQRMGDAHVFVARNVPALASQTYLISRKRPRGACFDNVPVMETDASFHKRNQSDAILIDLPYATAQVSRRSGILCSWIDRRTGREFCPRGTSVPLEHTHTRRPENALGVLQMIDESPNAMNAWLIHEVLREENLLKAAKVELLEQGPVFVRVRVEHVVRSSRIVEHIVFYRELPRVDFELEIDWRERGSAETIVPQLKMSFGTGIPAANARTEGPFTVVVRDANGLEQPTQKFVDVTGTGAGFTIYNDCKYGCDVRGGRVRMTLLRNTYAPDHESDNGLHTMRFAFEPYEGKRTNAECVRGGMAFNRPLLATRTNAPAGEGKPMLSISGSDSVVCTAFRRAEHSDRLLVRLFETSGKRAKATVAMAKAIRDAQEVNFLENPIAKVKCVRGKVEVAMHPFEVKTLAVKM